MRRLICRLLLLTLLLLPWANGSALALDIQKVRFGMHPDKTRMVVELNQKSDFRAFILPREDKKPYRLVIDLPPFEWQAGTISKPPKTTILDVRSGTLKPGIMRIVVDLENAAQIQKAFLLPATNSKPNRLVVDYKTISANQFANTQRKTFGTLRVDSKKLSLPKQTAEKQTKIKTSSSGIVIPPRKPRTVIKPTQTPSKFRTPLRKPLIVVDAGHGGVDPGAIGANKSREKIITLAAAKELKKQLESTKRYRVVLTRSNDKYLKLYKRVAVARTKDADLFISLHADSIGKSNVRGASVYTLSDKASDAQTAKLAARENQVDLIAGVNLSHEDKDVANILIDLAMRDTMNQSNFFANTVVSKMRSHGIRTLEKPHRYAGFAVLKAPDVPSVLIEMGFMSNKREAQLLATKDYQRKIASALTDSIDAYFTKVQKNNVR